MLARRVLTLTLTLTLTPTLTLTLTLTSCWLGDPDDVIPMLELQRLEAEERFMAQYQDQDQDQVSATEQTSEA